MPSAPPALRTVERLLSVRVTDVERLLPWSVLRCRLAGSPGSVIVKWLRDDPNGWRTDPRQVRTERAALEFVHAVGFRLAPRVLASDLSENLLVLEDLAPRSPLNDLLRKHGTTGPEARAGLLEFARALGALNAATAGLDDRYYAQRAALGQVEDPEPVLRRKWPETRRRLAELGVELTGSAERDLVAVTEILRNPGAFLALTNGDPESNNFLVDGAGADGRLTDFEFAGYRHALTSATCFHVPGPMWLTVADPLADACESTYRRALAEAVPEADDDERFGQGMAAACYANAFERLNRLPVLDERVPGETSRVQLVSTLEAAADTAERHRRFPDLTGWTRKVASLLRRRWPDTDVDLGQLASYTPRN